VVRWVLPCYMRFGLGPCAVMDVAAAAAAVGVPLDSRLLLHDLFEDALSLGWVMWPWSIVHSHLRCLTSAVPHLDVTYHQRALTSSCVKQSSKGLRAMSQYHMARLYNRTTEQPVSQYHAARL
jgi:hypothetical protein